MKHGNGIRLVAVLAVAASLVSLAQQGDGRPALPGGRKENGRPGFGQGGRRPDGFRMFMEKLKEKDPAAYERLEELRVTDRNAYFQELRKLMPARPMVPNKVGQLDFKCQKLSMQYHEARTEGEKEVIKKELVAAVEEATDAMIADMKERLRMMSERLAELEQNRQTAIEKRVEMLLSNKPGAHMHGGHAAPPPPPANGNAKDGHAAPPPPPAAE